MSKSPVELNVDGQTVRGTLYTPDKDAKKVGVLFLHGWTGKPNEAAAELLSTKGYYALTINMRGHGNSDGDIEQVSTKDSLDDALAAYDFLASRIPDGCRVAVVGNSYGSYIGIFLSAQRSLTGLSLRVPASYPDGSFEQPKWGHGHEDPRVDRWRHEAHPYTDNKGFLLLHNFEGKVQIIEAEKDEIIPAQTVKNFISAVSDQTKLDYHHMKDWPHSMGDDLTRNKQFQEILLTWLSQL